jgi:hypothetical protein
MRSVRFYAGLFLITACTLMIQLIQTRILSVVAWYHLAFFAISMAMFGLTAGAIWVYVRGERFTRETLSDDLTYYSSLFALSIAACFALQLSLALLSPGTNTSLASLSSWLYLAICIAVPFFFSGVAVSLALTRSPYPIGIVYGVDLIGAAAGCLGVLWLFNATDTPSAMLWVAVTAAAGAWLFSGSGISNKSVTSTSWLVRATPVLVAFLAILATFNSNTSRGLQLQVVKDRIETRGTFMFNEWNSFSRVSIAELGLKSPRLWGGSSTLPAGTTADMRFMVIDGLVGSPSYRFNGDLKEMDFLRYDVTNVAYALPDVSDVAIIGVGGGRDVLSAALFGADNITGVEINPIFVDLLENRPGYKEFTGFDKLPNVKLVVDEGRSWFARTDERFDVIQMSLIDTWAATGAGAFTLSENGLYTKEAWVTFLEKLTPNGVYTVSRWYSTDLNDETGRMISLATAALLELGVTDPSQHIFLTTQAGCATLVLSRSPFSDAGLAALNGVVDEMKFEVLLAPDRDPRLASETLASIIGSTSMDQLMANTSNLPLDLTPPDDNRPFFFNQLPLNRPLDAIKLARSMRSGDSALHVRGLVLNGNLAATITLIMLFCLALLLVAVAILWPLRRAMADAGRDVVIGGTAYFVLIGVGFMLLEIALLQRTSVVLGHPIYSLSVLLFSLILSTGIGSLISEKIVLNTRARFAGWAVLTALYIASLPYWAPAVFQAISGSELLVRAAVCVAVIAPAGLLLGFAFPTGMKIIAGIDPRPTPWFWGINGAAGVLASIFTVGNNIANGISSSLTLGAICYLLLIPTVFVFLMKRDTAK